MRQITEQELRRLSKLDALERGGVDNWEWYDESLKDWFAENEKLEQADRFINDLLEIICCDCKIHEPAGTGCGYAISDTKPVFDFVLKAVSKFTEE